MRPFYLAPVEWAYLSFSELTSGDFVLLINEKLIFLRYFGASSLHSSDNK